MPKDHVGGQVAIMNRTDQIIVAALLALTLARLVAIAITPLGLDVEEAQYWLWSETPAAGYFTKPPMIAWVIGLSTAVFGDSLFGIKAAAPVIQLLSSLLIWRIAAITASPLAGRLAALIWACLPAGALAGFVISTDSPMLFFLLAMLLVLAPLSHGNAIDHRSAGLAGVFAGLAMMAKYAAVYMPLGLVIWFCWEGRKHLRAQPLPILIFLAGMLVSLSPNLIWNMGNGFVTVGHLEHNANLGENPTSILRSISFLVAQAGVVGPVLLVLAMIAVTRRWHHAASRFWIALALPALSVITIQAFLSDANANWAVASWPPLVVLTAHWLAATWNGRTQLAGIAGIGVNTGVVFILLAATMAGSLGPLTPASDPLRRLRGWDVHAADLNTFMAETGAEAIITERRGQAAKLIWALRDKAIAVELLDRNGVAENHFEQNHPWRPVSGRKVVLVTETATPGHQQLINFDGQSQQSRLAISAKRYRDLRFFSGIER